MFTLLVHIFQFKYYTTIYLMKFHKWGLERVFGVYIQPDPYPVKVKRLFQIDPRLQ